MGVKIFLKNTVSGKEFEIVSRDLEAGTITLKGSFGQFTEKFDKERLKEAGYTMIQRDEDENLPDVSRPPEPGPDIGPKEDEPAPDELGEGDGDEEDAEFEEFDPGLGDE